MTFEARIAELITPTLEALGFELVRVQLVGQKHMRLQVMAEPMTDADGRVRGMDVDDCATISRALSALLDVEDPIEGAYDLEVSSPGLDRPLTRPKDFDRFAGHDAKVELFDARDGRKRFQGVLMGRDGENVLIRCEEEDYALPFAEVHKAKLILTDKLLAEAENMQ